MTSARLRGRLVGMTQVVIMDNATTLAESAMEIVQVAVETMQATRHRHQHEPDVTIRAIDAATDAIVAALDALQFLAQPRQKMPLQKTYWEE